MTSRWTEMAAMAARGRALIAAAKPKSADKSKDWRKKAEQTQKELQRLADQIYKKGSTK